MSEELKACPLCKGEAEIFQYCKNGLKLRCTKCHYGLQQKVLRKSLEWLRETMIKAWNTRTPDINTEMLEALKEATNNVEGIATYYAMRDEMEEADKYYTKLDKYTSIIQKAQEVEGE